LWRAFPATSLSLCATSSPANRSNSLEALSPTKMLAVRRNNTVFTLTQLFRKSHMIILVFWREIIRESRSLDRENNTPTRTGEKPKGGIFSDFADSSVTTPTARAFI
jgi:hypothetical protein